MLILSFHECACRIRETLSLREFDYIYQECRNRMMLATEVLFLDVIEREKVLKDEVGKEENGNVRLTSFSGHWS